VRFGDSSGRSSRRCLRSLGGCLSRVVRVCRCSRSGVDGADRRNLRHRKQQPAHTHTTQSRTTTPPLQAAPWTAISISPNETNNRSKLTTSTPTDDPPTHHHMQRITASTPDTHGFPGRGHRAQGIRACRAKPASPPAWHARLSAACAAKETPTGLAPTAAAAGCASRSAMSPTRKTSRDRKQQPPRPPLQAALGARHTRPGEPHAIASNTHLDRRYKLHSERAIPDRENLTRSQTATTATAATSCTRPAMPCDPSRDRKQQRAQTPAIRRSTN
jgi:hypothetical protein